MSEVRLPRVSFESAAMSAVEDHSFSRIDVEVGGFLLGSIDGDDVHVIEAHPALSAESHQTNLTFTHEAWNEIHAYVDAAGDELAIVGWYHTHPGFGLFLSDYDIFIQQNFFSAPGQFAMVVDPLIGKWANFVASSDAAEEFEQGETEHAAMADVKIEDVAEARAALLVPPPSRRSSVRAVGITAVVVAVLVGAVAWFIGSVQGQDAAQASNASEVQALQNQVTQLQDAMASPAPVVATPVEPSPTPSSAAQGAQPMATPGTPVLVTVSYVVRPGESWWGIASRILGSGQRFSELKNANPGVESLEPGMTIQVPLEAELVQLTVEGAQ